MKLHVFPLFLAVLLVQCTQHHAALYKEKPAFYAYIIGTIPNHRISHEYNADVFVTPASCQKIITALLAYKTLGPSYQYSTRLYTVKQGLYKNAAIVAFSGDPSLTSEDLYELLTPLKNKDLKGTIILDTSLFQTPAFSPNLVCDDIGKIYSRPISAMNLDQNLLTAKKSPEDLTLYIISKVRRVLGRLHIKAKIIIGSDPDKIPQHKTLVNTVQSKPLQSIIIPALKTSNNFVFDCLYLKIVNLQCSSPIKKWEEGHNVIKKLLQAHFDIDVGKALIIDGSGMSRYNRIQPRKLYELLCKAYKIQEFIDALPSPLELSTTLQQRTGLPKNIKAKTGALSGISGLCGYSFNNPRSVKAFVMIASNFPPPASEMHVIQDTFIRRFS